MPSLERSPFKSGLYKELVEQFQRYAELLARLFELQARVEVNERTVKATRDHLLAAIDESEGDVPEEWTPVLRSVRFLGMRLADACIEILREQGIMSIDELEAELNDGQFRFRTPSPLREINAALMRQRCVRREGDMLIFEAPGRGLLQLGNLPQMERSRPSEL